MNIDNEIKRRKTVGHKVDYVINIKGDLTMHTSPIVYINEDGVLLEDGKAILHTELDYLLYCQLEEEAK